MSSEDKAKTGKIPYDLILIFLVLLSGILVAGYAYYETQKAHIIKAQQDEFLAIADLKVKQIVNWRKERLGDATLIFDSKLISSPLSHFLLHWETSSHGPEILAWMKSLQRNYGYKTIILADAKGTVVLTTAGEEKRLGTYLERECKAALKSRKVIKTDLLKDSESGYTNIDLIVPLFLHGSQRELPAGTLILRIDARQVYYSLIRPWSFSGGSTETMLVRRDGDEIVYLKEPRQTKDAALSPRLQLSRSTLHEDLLTSVREGIVAGNDYRGVPVIEARRAIPDIQWYLVAKVDADEIYAPIRERAWLVAGFIGFLVVASGIAVGLWWWRRNRQMENLLRTSEARYRSLFEDSPISLWEEDFSKVRECNDNLRVQGVIDDKSYLNENPERVAGCLRQLKIIDVNQATLKLFKAETKEQLLENPAGIICSESIDAYRNELISIAHGDTQFHGETVLQTLMGDQLNVLVSLSVPPGYEKSWEKVIVSIIDISERKRAEEQIQQLLAQVRLDAAELEKRVAERTTQLKAANEQLESFAYSISHDLKAPLRGIDGYSRLLLEDYAPRLDDEGRLFVNTIRDSAQQMTQLIDDLLAYSRLERRNMAASTLRLPAFADAVLSPLLSQMESCRVTVNVSLQPAEIRADADALGMALRNLVDNAIKFTRNTSEPVIDINGEATETSYILRVRDNGIGFDMQYRERIFEIFQRLQRSEEYPGTGIGLALVRKAMERMGGRVWAESILGEGATFYLEVPQ